MKNAGENPYSHCTAFFLPLLYGQAWQVPFLPVCLPTCGVVRHTDTVLAAAAEVADTPLKAGS
jgi:hypothetical protein